MTKALTFVVLLLISFSGAIAQVVGRVDSKTKEFTIASDQKSEFSIIGYQFPNAATKHLICFSSNENMVREESAKCVLGAYFDTYKMKPTDKIVYLGMAGKFGKMNYVLGNGKTMIFYIPRSFYVIK